MSLFVDPGAMSLILAWSQTRLVWSGNIFYHRSPPSADSRRVGVSYKQMYVREALALSLYRVGSHVVSVRIHCTEKWRTSFHTDVLSKSK